MIRNINSLIHTSKLCRSQFVLFQSGVRLFSWKSRLGRDPEQRHKKLQQLQKRYTLRRLDTMDEDGDGPDLSVVLDNICADVEEIVKTVNTRVDQIVGEHSLSKTVFENILVGTVALKHLVSVTVPSAYVATVVVADRGNIERIHKALKQQLPSCSFSILGRERIEVRLREISERERDTRRRLIESACGEAEKQLKKLEELKETTGVDVTTVQQQIKGAVEGAVREVLATRSSGLARLNRLSEE